MASTGYRIVDEPRPGPLDRAVVSPTWPMFALMLGGAWLGWPWFLFNAWAMNSPRLGRNILWVVLGVLGSVAIGAGILGALSLELIRPSAIPYLITVLVLWKLLITYLLVLDQERSFELHQYFGGKVANGMLVMLVGSFYLDGQVLKAIGPPDTTLKFLLTLVVG